MYNIIGCIIVFQNKSVDDDTKWRQLIKEVDTRKFDLKFINTKSKTIRYNYGQTSHL